MSTVPHSSQPSEETALGQRTWVTVDEESRYVSLTVEGTEFVFSAGATEVAASVAMLRRLAARARFAAGALEQCHRELAARQAAWDELRAQPRCRLCAHPTTETHCRWCGTPST